MSETTDWNEPVSDKIASAWEQWKDTLSALETIRIPRPYVQHFSEKPVLELHVFSNAPQSAIAIVAYLRTIDSNGITNVGFILGKVGLAPTTGHTIPRLELCGAVLAIEICTDCNRPTSNRI